MGLWRHGKKCAAPPEPREESNDIKCLIAQNNKLLEHNQELTDRLVNICTNMPPQVVHHTSNTNTNTFNLHFFLNETCKDAMSLGEFVNSITPSLLDLEHTGKMGYVAGISNLVLRHLTDLDTSKRPIHCSDLKREVLYIKNDNAWQRESDTRPALTHAIKSIACKNVGAILKWKAAHPGCDSSCSSANDEYLNIVSNAMSGSTSTESGKNIGRIISTIAKGVAVVK